MACIGLVLLAAGGSSRLGAPKQLLIYEGRTLLRRAAETALASVCRPVVVVLGAHASRCRQELAGLDVLTVENGDWEQGMGMSLRAGLAALAAADVTGAVVCLCDQPRLSPDVINALVAAHEDTGLPMAASEYGGTLGVPALFHRALFPELMELREGAKPLLQRLRDQVAAVPFPGGTLDIDTPHDYEKLEPLP